MIRTGKRKWVVGTLLSLIVVAAAGLAWRDTLESWYYVRQLARAGAADRERLAERVAGLGAAAVPGLLDCLNGSDETVCANAGTALDKLGAHWGAGDARTVVLLRQIVEQWPRLSTVGRQQVLEAATNWVRAFPAEGQPAEGFVPAAADLLAAAAKDDAAIAAGLALCDCLMTTSGATAAREPACGLVRACLKSESAEVRLRAIQTSLRPGLDLVEQVAVLLNDPAVEVRRAAIGVVGPPDKAVPDETLLPCLHDPDPEVRRLCEEALTDLRGLKPIHVRLGKLLTHPDYLVRMQILVQLRELQRLEEVKNIKNPIDSGVWLCRLSHDPMASVRAAAASELAEQTRADCTRRLAEMARDDPSPTVCYLAGYYLRQAGSTGPGE